jgi:hypothetical protein
MNRTLLVLALLFAPSCKKRSTEAPVPTETGSAPGSAAEPTPSEDAPAMTAPKPVNEPSEPSLPSDARVISEREKKADLSSLGSDLAIQLLEKINPDLGDPERILNVRLVVTGAGSAVVDLGNALDPVSEEDGAKDLRAVAPLAPPRPFGAADASKPLPFSGPLLLLRKWRSGHLAIGRDGDALVVWRMDIGFEEDEFIGDWYEQMRLTLAPGAKLAAK